MELADLKEFITDEQVGSKTKEKILKKAERAHLDNRCLKALKRAKTGRELYYAYHGGTARKDAIQIASELGYDEKCLKDLAVADTDIEIERIMVAGRKRWVA